jgi:Raf kinase inhibitor-like YbhB/YbcL family protein
MMWNQRYLFYFIAVFLFFNVPGRLHGKGGVSTHNGVSQGMMLYSGSFTHGTFIPREYSRGDMNISPHFIWEKAPAHTKSFALICVDQSAGNFVHWIIFNIPPQIHEFSKGFRPPKDILQGQNGFREQNNWQGPQPSQGSGEHNYLFTLYALDVPELRTTDGSRLQEGATYEQVTAACEGHILEEAYLLGKYSYME